MSRPSFQMHLQRAYEIHIGCRTGTILVINGSAVRRYTISVWYRYDTQNDLRQKGDTPPQQPLRTLRSEVACSDAPRVCLSMSDLLRARSIIEWQTISQMWSIWSWYGRDIPADWTCLWASNNFCCIRNATLGAIRRLPENRDRSRFHFKILLWICMSHFVGLLLQVLEESLLILNDLCRDFWDVS